MPHHLLHQRVGHGTLCARIGVACHGIAPAHGHQQPHPSHQQRSWKPAAGGQRQNQKCADQLQPSQRSHQASCQRELFHRISRQHLSQKIACTLMANLFRVQAQRAVQQPCFEDFPNLPDQMALGSEQGQLKGEGRQQDQGPGPQPTPSERATQCPLPDQPPGQQRQRQLAQVAAEQHSQSLWQLCSAQPNAQPCTRGQAQQPTAASDAVPQHLRQQNPLQPPSALAKPALRQQLFQGRTLARCALLPEQIVERFMRKTVDFFVVRNQIDPTAVAAQQQQKAGCQPLGQTRRRSQDGRSCAAQQRTGFAVEKAHRLYL